MRETERDAQDTATRADVIARDPTGVPGLDEVLGGGIMRGALVLVVGPPGSGKTTLALQAAWAAAQQGRRVLILSTLSESPLQLVVHLRTYHFFTEQHLGDTIQIISAAPFLAQGPEAATGVLTAVRQQRASLVVLDGFSGMRALQATPAVGRQLLATLSSQLSLLGITTLITSAGAPRAWAEFPEATTADMLVGLSSALAGSRGRRTIDVIKVRGAAPLSGLHGLTLDAHGITVYPRLETRIARAALSAAPPHAPSGPRGERATFDLPALDALLEGGVSVRTSTLIVGSSGVGKTLLGLHFALAGVRRGQAAVYLGFHEAREELLDKLAPFAIGPTLEAALAPGGGLTLLRFPSVECDADVLADTLLRAVDSTGARRVVIDSIAELERAVLETSDVGRIPNYLAALLEALRLRGVTTVLIRETGILAATTFLQQADLISLVAANVVWLQQVVYGERLYRVLSVPKMRFSAHDVTLREYTITAPHGLVVRSPESSRGGVLSGIARQQGQPGHLAGDGLPPSVHATRPRSGRRRQRQRSRG